MTAAGSAFARSSDSSIMGGFRRMARGVSGRLSLLTLSFVTSAAPFLLSRTADAATGAKIATIEDVSLEMSQQCRFNLDRIYIAGPEGLHTKTADGSRVLMKDLIQKQYDDLGVGQYVTYREVSSTMLQGFILCAGGSDVTDNLITNAADLEAAIRKSADLAKAYRVKDEPRLIASPHK